MFGSTSTPIILSSLVLLAGSGAHASTVGERATYTCAVTADCSAIGYSIPANSHYYCAKGTCSWSR